MLVQLLTKNSAASASMPRSGNTSLSRTGVAMRTTINTMMSAGSSRLARRSQKCLRSRSPLRAHVEIKIVVMRYPLSVKNTPTPSRPPASHGAPR